MAGSSPPLPTTVRALHFYREKISALSSLVDSRRIVLALVIPWYLVKGQRLEKHGSCEIHFRKLIFARCAE